MNNRKYMILDTVAKALALDADGDPIRCVTLKHALAKAVELRGLNGPDAFAVLDDLGNKWLWSAKGVLRVAIGTEAKEAVTDKVNDESDWRKISTCYTARVRPDGIVETQHHVRLADGPPIVDPNYRWEVRITTERWSDPQWIERGPLAAYIDHLPTRVHKLEQRAMNEKARSTRAAERAKLQLAAHEAGEAMTCQICARLISSKFGTIAHHGYTRPGYGYQTASCSGTHEAPFEVSNAALVAEIETLEGYVEELKKQISAVQAGRAPVIVSVKPHWSEGRSYPYRFSFTADTYAAVSAESEGRLDGGVPIESRKEHYVYELEGNIKAVSSHLSDMRKRNAGWKKTRVFVDGEFKPFVCEAAA